MPETPWKRRERRTAEQLGGTRTSRVGRSTPDVTTPWLVAEVKSKKELPAWILEALAKARSHAKDVQLPILVLHQRGMKDDLVVLKMSDFKEWFGNDRNPS